MMQSTFTGGIITYQYGLCTVDLREVKFQHSIGVVKDGKLIPALEMWNDTEPGTYTILNNGQYYARLSRLANGIIHVNTITTIDGCKSNHQLTLSKELATKIALAFAELKIIYEPHYKYTNRPDTTRWKVIKVIKTIPYFS